MGDNLGSNFCVFYINFQVSAVHRVVENVAMMKDKYETTE